MRVVDLIEQLKRFPPDATICIGVYTTDVTDDPQFEDPIVFEFDYEDNSITINVWVSK